MPPKEAHTVIAIGGLEGEEFVPASIAYWRVLAGPGEIVVSVAPVATDGAERDEAATVVIPDPTGEMRRLVDQLGAETARVLRAMYGEAA